WGANDFDDAAPMPYVLDLVRLATSAALAREESSPTVREICDTLVEGYLCGLKNLEPIILDDENRKMREALVLDEDEREKFWQKLQLPPEQAGSQPAYEAAFRRCLPQSDTPLAFARRSAGTGSLGRPRFVATVRWKGGKVVREAKRL